MATSASAIRSLLLPGLDAVFEAANERPLMWPEIFEKHSTEKAFERDVEVKTLGIAQLRAEGASVAYDDMGERGGINYRWVQLALGFIITRNAIRDNLYKDRFNPNAKALKRSIRQAQEVYAAAVLNNAMDSTGAYYGLDGQPLLSTAHPIDTGTVANTPSVAAQLSETALQDALTGIGYFKDAAGLYSMVRPEKLIAAPDLRYVIARLMTSTLRVGTADNDINALRSLGELDSQPILNHFITNKNAWFIKTDAPEGLKAFERDPIESDMQTDFDTDSLKVKATWRGGFGYTNFRALWGSMP